jgi:hypothetical protein
MIIREYVACATCDKSYCLRVQVGVRTKQKHIFHCVSCREKIGLTLDLKEGITLDENCVRIDPSTEALAYYLSSDFVASAEEIHDPKSIPSIHFMQGMIQKLKIDEFLESNPVNGDVNEDPTWQLDSIWPDLQKAWRLADAGQFELSATILQKFCLQHDIDRCTLEDAQFFFLAAICPPNDALIEEIAVIKALDESKFKDFAIYYATKVCNEHKKDFYAVFTKFFNAFLDFTQVLLYAKHGQPMPENARATSVNFEGVSSFYADCYEFYAGAIHLYTCLNNIKNGRKFDELAKIPLEKYLTTDKAERRKSFSDNPVFQDATSEFDSQIRNASFHNWFRLAENKQDIEFRSGGTGAFRTISYAAYLHQCTRIFIQICHLFMLELVFDEYVKSKAINIQG